MAAEWYYSDQGHQRGPIGLEELQELATSGRLQPSDLVWRAGMADWVAAETRSELFGPAVRRRPAEAAPARAEEREFDRPRPRPSSNSALKPVLIGCGVLGCLGIVCCGIIGVIAWKQQGPANERGWSLAKGQHIHWAIRFQNGDNVVITVASKKDSDMDLFVFDDKGKMDSFLKNANLDKAVHLCVAYDNGVSKDCSVSFKAAATRDYWVLLINRLSQDQPGRNMQNSGTLVFLPAPK